jgi:N-methylhydantoinase A/oxoprolinase/acetone carboxylase beta subunit
VTERVDYKGRVVKPLDEAEVRDLGRLLKNRGYRAVAVCFMNSYAHPSRTACKAILEDALAPTLCLRLGRGCARDVRAPPPHDVYEQLGDRPVVVRYIEALDNP